MTDPLRAQIEQLKIMKESASRRSSLYSDMGTLNDSCLLYTSDAADE